YSSTRFLTSPESQKPKREKRFDNYGNVIKTIDTQGYETDNDFDVRNKLVQTTYPEVPVNNKNGTYSKMRPTTKRGYNERGVKIGRTDGNNHTTGFVVDENGQPLKKILPDGTVIEQKTFNALQQMVVFTDSRGKNYTFGFDGKNNIIWRETPLKLIERFWYNEAGFLGSVTDSAGKTRYYVRDINGNIVANISPMGKRRQFVYDLVSNKPIRQINSDGTFLSSVIDAFGFTHQHIELDGSEVFTEYNFLMQVIHLSSQGGNHGTLLSYVMVTGRIPGGYLWGTYYQITTTPTPPQDLHFTYRQDGIISGAFDMAWPRTTELIHDSERRQISFKATEAGTLIRQIVSAYDAMSRPRLTYGTQEIIKMSYDGTINIIQRTVTLIPPIGNPVVDDSWNLPGPNDDMQIYAGALVKVGNNSQIGIQPNKGEAYSSQFGLRTTQSYQDDKGVTHTETLSYDDDSRLSGSSSTDGFVTSRTYDGAGRPNGYSSNYPTDPHGTSQSQGCTYDDDSELLTANTSMTTWKLEKVLGMWIWMPTTNQSNTTYGNLNGYGMPGSQQSVYPQPDDDPVVDNLTDTYVNREIPELVQVAGTRTDSDGTGPWNSANNFTGTNPGELTGQSQTQDLTQASVLRQDCLFGMTLQRADFHGDGIPGMNSVAMSFTLNSYFYDILRNIAGSMSMRLSAGQSSNFGVNMGNMMPGVRGVLAAAGPAVSDVTTDFTIGKKMINPVDKSYPPMSSGIVDVKDGDTLETIAQQNCGTTQAVSAIQALNGGINDQQLVNGNTIKLPQWIQSKYQVTTTEDYNILVNSIMVNLYPQLIAAQPDDDSFWDEFIDVVIVVVAVAIGLASGGLGIPAAMASAALMEAGAEEGEIALGMRSEFSWKAVIQIAIEAGFAEYAAANIPTSFEAAVMQAGKLAVEEQLLEIATGVQNGFNIQEVLIQMASAGVMYQAGLAINAEEPEAQQAVRVGNQVVSTTTNRTVDEFVKYTELNLIGTVSSGILSAAFEGQKIDLESMAAQFLGSEVGKILSTTPMVQDIGKGIQQVAQNNPLIKSMNTDVDNIVDDISKGITKVENAVERFFDPNIASPNAQVPAASVKPKPSQARAMARHGIYSQRTSQPNYLGSTDENGSYMPNSLGSDLGLGDDPAIDNFDPNAYGDNSGATVSGSGVNKVPSENPQSSQSYIKPFNSNSLSGALAPTVSSTSLSLRESTDSGHELYDTLSIKMVDAISLDAKISAPYTQSMADGFYSKIWAAYHTIDQQNINLEFNPSSESAEMWETTKEAAFREIETLSGVASRTQTLANVSRFMGTYGPAFGPIAELSLGIYQVSVNPTMQNAIGVGGGIGGSMATTAYVESTLVGGAEATGVIVTGLAAPEIIGAAAIGTLGYFAGKTVAVDLYHVVDDVYNIFKGVSKQ
ncbi:MAG: LysM domain-containing protein, partial [Gammaproteobacteria bacterium]|nr:LysM domain-containing protein [Gammaproteobacteria bacterium]